MVCESGILKWRIADRNDAREYSISDVGGTSSNEYLVTNTLQARELQYNTDNSYSEMQNDKISRERFDVLSFRISL